MPGSLLGLRDWARRSASSSAGETGVDEAICKAVCVGDTQVPAAGLWPGSLLAADGVA
jgi:hypothetical protein